MTKSDETAMAFGICLALILCIVGCSKTANVCKDTDACNIEAKHVCYINNTFEISKITVDGHDYLIYRNEGLCHSASCPCMDKRK